MKGQLKAVSGLLIYVAAGLLAVITAAWLSSQFIGRAVSQTPPPEAGKPAAAASPGPAAAGKNVQQPAAPVVIGVPKGANPLADIIEDYTYVSKGKRDPFQPFERPRLSNSALGPLWPLQRFDLDQLRLVGIIWDVKTPKAMILDPNGKGYVVTVNERIGRNNGYIARIREGEIIIVESVTGTDGKLSYQTKFMKLQQE